MMGTSINEHNNLNVELKCQIVTCSFPPTPTNLKYQELANFPMPWTTHTPER